MRKGQPLLVVESPDYVAAQIDLANARADLDKDLQGNESALALTQAELRRAMAALAVAQSRLLIFGKTPGDIAMLNAGVDRALTIAAPITGTVVDRQVGPGQILRADAPTPLFQISSLSTLWVRGDVFESDLPYIRLGAPAEIRVESYPKKVFSARVSFIDPTVDPAERGSDLQLRPVLMTALAAAIGLLPAAVATGIGSETQRPLARVVVGGMVSSAAVILLVLPAIYLLAHRRREQRRIETEFNHPGSGGMANV